LRDKGTVFVPRLALRISFHYLLRNTGQPTNSPKHYVIYTGFALLPRLSWHLYHLVLYYHSYHFLSKKGTIESSPCAVADYKHKFITYPNQYMMMHKEVHPVLELI
jgi:hypothetical protein